MTEFVFGPGMCGALDESSRREWLVADGRGGYAMGTVAGLRTRRYHGLLVVAGDPPAVRRLALAALDPTVVLPSGARVRLGAHEWASGAVRRRGPVARGPVRRDAGAGPDLRGAGLGR